MAPPEAVFLSTPLGTRPPPGAVFLSREAWTLPVSMDMGIPAYRAPLLPQQSASVRQGRTDSRLGAGTAWMADRRRSFGYLSAG